MGSGETGKESADDDDDDGGNKPDKVSAALDVVVAVDVEAERVL